jgi:hypothetical protein
MNVEVHKRSVDLCGFSAALCVTFAEGQGDSSLQNSKIVIQDSKIKRILNKE